MDRALEVSNVSVMLNAKQSSESTQVSTLHGALYVHLMRLYEPLLVTWWVKGQVSYQ